MKSFKNLIIFAFCAAFAPLNAAIIATDLPNSKVIDVPIKEPSIDMMTNLVYSQPAIYGYANKPLKMDIIYPVSDDKKRHPAVLFVPGGGFISSNRTKFIQPRTELAKAGYVVASIEYRVAPEAIFPAPIIDVKSAVRFLRANADRFNIDVDRIAIMGNSAGGYLAALAGTSKGEKDFEKGENLNFSSDVRAVVDIYGLSDLNKIGDGYSDELINEHHSPSAPEALWLNGMATNTRTSGSVLDFPERAKVANPITYVNKSTPPFLIMVGDADTRVSPRQSQLMHEALLKAGASSELVIIKGAEHGGAHWSQQQVIDIIIKFLDKNLK